MYNNLRKTEEDLFIMSLLTKVARGVAFGDVSNTAARNILTELSKELYAGITEQEMEDTMDFFNWECPYTGRPLKQAIIDCDGSYATDHVYPQNKVWCGLNVKGNLIIVDKKANAAKGTLDVKTFMETDSDFWRDLGIDKPTRMARLKKIQDFQTQCGYDPEKIRKEISAILVTYYDDIRKEQEKMIETCIAELEKSGITPLSKKAAAAAAAVTSPAPTAKPQKRGSTPDLIFYPSDENAFKAELLKSKKAHFNLTYASGKSVTSPWKANNFDADSSLRSNIQSRPFWRNKAKEGLIKVEVYID